MRFVRKPMDVKRILAFLLIVIAAEALIASTIVPNGLEQGKYLVESVAICFECHSERDFSKPGWPIPPGRVGGGRVLSGEGTPVISRNRISILTTDIVQKRLFLPRRPACASRAASPTGRQ